METALREVDRGIIEATQAMGATTRQIVVNALLPEALPGIIAATTVTAITWCPTPPWRPDWRRRHRHLAVRYGYQRYQPDVMLVTVVLLLVLVQVHRKPSATSWWCIFPENRAPYRAHTSQRRSGYLPNAAPSNKELYDEKLIVAVAALAAFSAQAESLSVAATAVPHAKSSNSFQLWPKKALSCNIKSSPTTCSRTCRWRKAPGCQLLPAPAVPDEFNKSRGTELNSVAGVQRRALSVLIQRSTRAWHDLPARRQRGDPQRRHQRRPRPAAAAKGRGDQMKPEAGAYRHAERHRREKPRSHQGRELEAATLPRVLTQVDLALINTNYALEAKLNPTKDALAIEGSDSPYVNILVARADSKDNAAQNWPRRCTSPEVESLHPGRSTRAPSYRRSDWRHTLRTRLLAGSALGHLAKRIWRSHARARPRHRGSPAAAQPAHGRFAPVAR